MGHSSRFSRLGSNLASYPSITLSAIALDGAERKDRESACVKEETIVTCRKDRED